MKATVTLLAKTTAVLALAGAALLPAGPGVAQKSGDKLPYTFVCKHCKIKMTVKSKEEWKKKCWVCPCKTTALACKPAPKSGKK